MLAYTSFISDVRKFYRVEKIVLHHLIFLLIKIKNKFNWFQTQFYHNCKGFYMAKACGIKLRL